METARYLHPEQGQDDSTPKMQDNIFYPINRPPNPSSHILKHTSHRLHNSLRANNQNDHTANVPNEYTLLYCVSL